MRGVNMREWSLGMQKAITLFFFLQMLVQPFSCKRNRDVKISGQNSTERRENNGKSLKRQADIGRQPTLEVQTGLILSQHLPSTLPQDGQFPFREASWPWQHGFRSCLTLV